MRGGGKTKVGRLFGRGTSAGRSSSSATVAAGGAGASAGSGAPEVELRLNYAGADVALDTGAAASALTGTIYKRSRKGGSRWSSWEQRFTQLLAGYCLYFKAEADARPQNFFELRAVAAVRPLKAGGGSDRDYTLEVELDGGKVYQFALPTAGDCAAWFGVLGAIVLRNNAAKGGAVV